MSLNTLKPSTCTIHQGLYGTSTCAAIQHAAPPAPHRNMLLQFNVDLHTSKPMCMCAAGDEETCRGVPVEYPAVLCCCPGQLRPFQLSAPAAAQATWGWGTCVQPAAAQASLYPGRDTLLPYRFKRPRPTHARAVFRTCIGGIMCSARASHVHQGHCPSV